jgi:hypothetical protein
VCSEASAVMAAVVAYFFLNRWNLKVSPDKSDRHIPWCVHYHEHGFGEMLDVLALRLQNTLTEHMQLWIQKLKVTLSLR